MSVLATSTPVTKTKEEAVEAAAVGKDGTESKSKYPNLAQVSCIWYPITFRKKSVSTLLDSGSEVNAIHPTFARELGLLIRPTDIIVQKIDGTILDTYRIVVTAFSVLDKTNQVRFFEKTFLVVNVSPEIVFKMPFLILSDADVDFLGRKFRWRTYTTKEALSTIRRIELVGKKEFAAVALDSKYETYVVHVGSVSSGVLPSSSPLEFNVHPFCRSQVSGLIAKKALIKIPAKYLDFADVFSPDLISKLSKNNGINNYAIELVKGWQQPPDRPIYSLGPVELETLKAYIKTNLANGFIKLSKLPAGAPILFDQKFEDFFRLCVNYRGFNNLTIKNRYLLPLIGEFLNRLGRAKRFIQLNLTSAYYQIGIRKGDEWKTAFRTWYSHFEY